MPKPLLFIGAIWLPIASVVVVSIYASRVELQSTAQFLKKVAEAPPPRLDLPRKKYDFGRLEPGQIATHKFPLRNSGGKILRLAPTAPDDVYAEVPEDRLAAGVAGILLVRWSTGWNMGRFEREIRLQCNDVDQREVVLEIAGEVHTPLALDPPMKAVGKIPPHKPTVVEALVFSTLWDQIHIRETRFAEDLKVDFEAASAKELAQRHARSGKRVRVEIPAGRPRGSFDESIRITASPSAQSTTTQTCELQLRGRVLRPLAIYGKIEFTGVIDIGKIYEGEARKLRLRMKVRDEQLDLPVTKIETTPDFLQARVTPVNPNGPPDGNYNLDVEVTNSAPECNFRVHRMGTIQLEFDHPRIQRQDLRASFAVIPRNG